jgi:hypothetical protein
MDDLDDIVAGIPMNALADQLGVDPTTAESAVRQALPALLGGLQANAADPAGAASLAGALDEHPPDLVAGGVDLNQVDTDDGQKIVGNIFGSNTDQVAQTLGGNLGGGSGDLIKKLLPLLAPIVLSYLSSRMRGGVATGNEPQPSGGVGDLLGSILGGMGGGMGTGASSTSGGSVLDMLGGLLGGGRR